MSLTGIIHNRFTSKNMSKIIVVNITAKRVLPRVNIVVDRNFTRISLLVNKT